MKQVVNSFVCVFVATFLLLITSCYKDVKEIADFTKTIETDNSTLIYSVEKLTIKSNNLLKLSIQATTSECNSIEFPELISIEHFIQIDKVISQGESVGANDVQFECRYILEPTIPGEYTIPSFEVKIMGKSNKSVIVAPKVAVTVKSLFAEGYVVEIMDLEPEVVKDSNKTLLYILVVVVVVITVLIVISKLFKTKHADSKTPIREAEHDISKLQTNDTNYALKLHFICISYLEKQIKKTLRTASNEEIMTTLSEMRIFNAELLELTKKLLDDLNRTKFSKEGVVTADICAKSLEFLSRSSVSFEISREFEQGEES